MEHSKQETAATATPDPAAGDVEAGRQVLRTEAEALNLAATLLDGAFSQAVDVLLATAGRVIVSGQGKPGHIGRKIAATFASTGTPAHFVHPSEASHGDLGMVTKADSLLMLSNSGETRELSDLLVHTKRSQIPLIAMTGRADSALGTQADVVLLLPKAPEACPMGLAPTTSSTLMLALGDALAVALMHRRGFTRDDYKVLHPGGTLGQMLIKVGDIMHTGEALPRVSPETPMTAVCEVMNAKTAGFSSLGFTTVVDAAGRLVGIITDGDLRRHFSADFINQTASAIMSRTPRTIGASALVAEAVHEMNEGGSKRITQLIVTEGDRPIGFIHMQDCLMAGVR
jgi:arabinose-5-phosphate isomerase